MRTRWIRNLGTVATIGALTLSGCSNKAQRADEQPAEADVAEPVHIKVLAFNDLHGHLEGPSGSVTVDGSRVDAGGFDRLAARAAEIKKFHANTAIVTAGDFIGASPLLSSLFHDEPTVEGLNALQIDAASVGNHEFDEGADELRRMQDGGCHPVDGCQDGDPYDGASFPFLAANVIVDATGESIFPGWFVKEMGGVKVGFIGLTLEGTPAIVSPDGIKGLTFQDEADTINEATKKLQAEGVETIVVLIHEGGYATTDRNDVNDCPGVSGPIVDIVERTDKAVDVFVTGHTHQAYICDIDERLVTASKSYARLLTEIDLMVDPVTGDVVEKKATNLVIDRTGDPHPEVAGLIEKYSKIADPLANKKIGVIRTDISRDPDDNGESPLGRLIADIQLDATKSKERGSAQIAFMNPGGIRDSLRLAPSGEEENGVVTYEEAHTIQPFGNSLITMTLTGQQIHDLLEMQWQDQDRVRLLQVSNGFQYAWSEGAEPGDKVEPASMKLNGEPLALDGSYRVTVNSFLATGGDGFSILNDGTERIGGPVDLEAFVVYLDENSPVSAPDGKRITRKK